MRIIIETEGEARVKTVEESESVETTDVGPPPDALWASTDQPTEPIADTELSEPMAADAGPPDPALLGGVPEEATSELEGAGAPDPGAEPRTRLRAREIEIYRNDVGVERRREAGPDHITIHTEL